MPEVLRFAGAVVVVLWMGCVALLLLLWLYGAVMSWLIAKAWEPVELLSREIEDDVGAEGEGEEYLRWLERDWRKRG